ncbi:enoyl-CoA hydratase/isomerase family protein [Gordonia polyisoprenivorans]|uniref:enoyl-CoA hydratase/isomerase family protein n=1 Tax=Gordonia polyisoprenivorans TaxID=84595 RepID=UPI001AD71BC4|nr:enoyl-CoA hydratase/isomerase family protein [Gordonia polyisoprenivorans]QTI69050.1 enoyl-CoA hydratase/isomerase family protein [Gordonia polyisoprenivorans]
MSVVNTTVHAGVATVTLNRPDSMNAITVELGRELDREIRACATRADVAVIAVRGSGGNFCAGGDFDEVQRLRAEGVDALRVLFTNFGDACRAIAECPVPVIAVVEGVAMAGGFEFMQAADIALVRDDARIADNHIRFGQIPGGGSTARLASLVGRQQALGLLLSGDRISGVDAARLGLAYAHWPADDFDREVAVFLSKLASRRRDAVIGIKKLVYQSLSRSVSDSLDAELNAVVAHISSDAGQDGVTSFATRK